MGERLTSRAHAHPCSMVPNGIPSSPYFGLSPAQLLHLVLVDPTHEYLKSMGHLLPCAQDKTPANLPRLTPQNIHEFQHSPSATSHTYQAGPTKHPVTARNDDPRDDQEDKQ